MKRELEFENELDNIIKKYKQCSTEPLDKSEVDVLVNHLRNMINLKEGNITQRKYNELESHSYPLKPTVFRDMNGNTICIGHVVELILDGGEARCFNVTRSVVEREIVSHNGYVPPTSKVVIDGIMFGRDGRMFFPNVDENGVWDTSKMKIVGRWL